MKKILLNDMSIIIAYLAGNYIGTYFSTKSKEDDDKSNKQDGTSTTDNRPA